MANQDALYRLLFEQVAEGLIVTDRVGNMIMVNPRAVEMFGFTSADELVNQHIEILIPSRFHGAHKGYKEDYMNKPANRPMGVGRVLYAVRADGSEFPVEISLSTYVDEETGDRKAIALVSDITERQKMQDELKALNEELEALVAVRSTELRKSNLLYKSIARNFPRGSIYVFNRELEYIFADGQELKKRGLSGDDLVGKRYQQMTVSAMYDQVHPHLEKVFEGEEQSFEVDHLNATFSLHGVPLKDSLTNEIDRILVVEREVTQEKKIEKEIKESLERERELNNLKSRFVSIVSHEFRTPLAAIKSSSELIEKYTEGDQQEKRTKHTDRISNSVDHLNGMIEDILSLSKIEEGKIEFNKETFYIDEILDMVIKQNKEVYPDQNFVFEIDHHEIVSDKKLCTHVLGNIISNAFKYTPNEKLVKVVVTEPDNWIQVCVKDEGIGIPESEQKELFGRFYRATNAQNIKGTGLGLNIVSKYLEYLGGEIEFSSAENQGSEFIVRLPKTPK